MNFQRLLAQTRELKTAQTRGLRDGGFGPAFTGASAPRRVTTRYPRQDDAFAAQTLVFWLHPPCYQVMTVASNGLLKHFKGRGPGLRTGQKMEVLE